jgi:hypothetical protein
VSILIKAGTGLAAGIVAGGLGLAFFPRVEPTVLKPRNAVEKPQFVASAPTPAVVAATRAAPALAVASEAPGVAPPPKPTPVATTVEPKPAPKAAPEAKASPEPKPAPVALASLDPPKAPPAAPAKPAASPLGETRSISLAPVAAPAAPAKPTPTLAETRALAPQPAAPPIASAASARWSVRGLIALAKGDLSSARLYLARAAEAGDPRALVALADTYDPAMLAKLGAVVAPGDAQRAKELLVKAAAAGVVGAKDRVAALDER